MFEQRLDGTMISPTSSDTGLRRRRRRLLALPPSFPLIPAMPKQLLLRRELLCEYRLEPATSSSSSRRIGDAEA